MVLVKDKYHGVAQLGFEETLEDKDTLFYQVLNKSLLQVCRIRPALRRAEISHFPLLPSAAYEGVYAKHKEDIVFDGFDVRGYSFEISGVCSYIIEQKTEDGYEPISAIRNISCKSGFTKEKGFFKNGSAFISGAVRIRFTGDFSYKIRNIAFYDILLSEDIADVPLIGEETEYDLHDIVDDFLDFATQPEPVVNYKILRNGVISVPYDYEGTISIVYIHKPKEIEMMHDPMEDEQVIDLDDELADLLDNLIAAYVLADEDDGKAGNYLNLYQERVQDIQYRAKVDTPIKIYTNGW